MPLVAPEPAAVIEHATPEKREADRTLWPAFQELSNVLGQLLDAAETALAGELSAGTEREPHPEGHVVHLWNPSAKPVDRPLAAERSPNGPQL